MYTYWHKRSEEFAMVSYMDNVVDNLGSQVLRGKLDELTHFVRHKLNFSFIVYKEYESIESL